MEFGAKPAQPIRGQLRQVAHGLVRGLPSNPQSRSNNNNNFGFPAIKAGKVPGQTQGLMVHEWPCYGSHMLIIFADVDFRLLRRSREGLTDGYRGAFTNSPTEPELLRAK